MIVGRQYGSLHHSIRVAVRIQLGAEAGRQVDAHTYAFGINAEIATDELSAEVAEVVRKAFEAACAAGQA